MAAACERLLLAASLASSVLLGGCRVADDLVAEPALSVSGGGGGGTSGASGGGGQASSSDDCSPDRASIWVPLVDGNAQARCSAWAARRSFAHAVCSCSDLNVQGALVTDALDSSRSGAGSGRGAAAVGVNGVYPVADYVRVDGSFSVASDVAIDSPGGFDIVGDLRLAGATRAAGPILVSRDAWLGGATSTLSVANIGRNLHLSAKATLQALVPAMVAGDTVQDAFESPPPCACGEGETLDIGGIVAATLSDNDNARLGLELDALAQVTAPTELTLSCGRFALRGIAGRGAISLRVSGRVALAVDGDVQIPPGFSLVLEPDAQLDWFIAGSLSLSLDARIGDEARASAVRAYVLGSNEIVLPGTEGVAMNVYAPRASVMIESLGNTYGAVFAGAIASRTALVAHYDRAVLRADEACRLEPPPACTSCDQCSAGATCIGGSCAACVNDADCCFPLACEQGQCQGLVTN